MYTSDDEQIQILKNQIAELQLKSTALATVNVCILEILTDTNWFGYQNPLRQEQIQLLKGVQQELDSIFKVNMFIEIYGEEK